jgi:hypothetical protein
MVVFNKTELRDKIEIADTGIYQLIIKKFLLILVINIVLQFI